MFNLGRVFAGAMVGAALWAGAAGAEDYGYPVDTVTLTTHSKPGSGSDLFLRKLSAALSKEMGITFVIDYWAGGSGAKAMAQLAASKPDGSVFYATTPTHINTSLLSKPEVSYEDIDYIANVFFDPEIIYTLTSSPFNTMKEAVDASKAAPGTQIWGASTPGSLERQILERINRHADAKAIIVPHDDGSGLLINVLNGTVALGVGELQEVQSYLQAGKMKVIGVYYPERLATLPDVPTIQEMGLDDKPIRKFRGLAGPKGIPAETAAKIGKAIDKILKDEDFIKVYSADNLVPGYMDQETYRSFMTNFVEEERVFIKDFGITE